MAARTIRVASIGQAQSVGNAVVPADARVRLHAGLVAAANGEREAAAEAAAALIGVGQSLWYALFIH